MNVWTERAWMVVGLAVLTGCPGGDPPIAEGVFGELGAVLPAATEDERETFLRGKEVAERRFTPEEGLGPEFNVTFCGSCHEKPVTGGSGPRYRNFLLVGQRLEDGSYVESGTNGVQPMYRVDGVARPATDVGTNTFATRNAIPFFGTGLIAELPDEIILENADPDDEDGDGISGRPNYDRGFVGRFGRKAQTVSVEGFIRGPLFNHLGITTNPLSEEMKARLPVPSAADLGGVATGVRGIGQTVRGQAAAPDEPTVDDDGVPDPELSEQDLFDVVAFSMLLAAPQPDAPTAQTQAGQAAFDRIGCVGCHVTALEGPRGMIPLYSDLLLHDMGEALADGVPMKEASGAEFRTQPLWGLTATGPYLHDGRADTIDAAIRLHGGEGQASADAYAALSDVEQGDLLAFLESLGGAAQKSPGLEPPDAPEPLAGELGAPVDGMLDADKFKSGRRVFDRDFGLGEGLGPVFNGDSCRACHFEPTLGGAGPLGVNVMRHGYDDGQGTSSDPAIGTMAFKFLSAVDRRPDADDAATVFEMRQTPPVFGLGRIGAIPEATILALEDPQDMDSDGIRGIAHRLPDGRLGRFGWKANVPAVAEFARDATTVELGMTVPPQDGLTFGSATDADDRPDPEMDLGDLEALAFWLENLAPPPRRSVDPSAEAQGAQLFADVGCDGCHIPSLDDADGVPVELFSDLLLHDVQPAGFVGIADGMASPRHFRTPPLWGIGDTAPYMHHGMATTLEDAIAGHETEAEASRMAYEALGEADRAALLAFLRSL